MNSQLACFLVGVVTTIFWLIGIKRGTMLGIFNHWGKWSIRREDEPAAFWVQMAFAGVMALAFLILPVLFWLGWRK
jgi:hypothetical protein